MIPLNVKGKRRGLAGYFLLYHQECSFMYLFNKSGERGGRSDIPWFEIWAA